MTVPDGIVSLEAVVTVPTTRFAATRFDAAVASNWLVTSGTSIGAAPLETTRSTAVPADTHATHATGF